MCRSCRPHSHMASFRCRHGSRARGAGGPDVSFGLIGLIPIPIIRTDECFWQLTFSQGARVRAAELLLPAGVRECSRKDQPSMLGWQQDRVYRKSRFVALANPRQHPGDLHPRDPTSLILPCLYEALGRLGFGSSVLWSILVPWSFGARLVVSSSGSFLGAGVAAWFYGSPMRSVRLSETWPSLFYRPTTTAKQEWQEQKHIARPVKKDQQRQPQTKCCRLWNVKECFSPL